MKASSLGAFNSTLVGGYDCKTERRPCFGKSWAGVSQSPLVGGGFDRLSEFGMRGPTKFEESGSCRPIRIFLPCRHPSLQINWETLNLVPCRLLQNIGRKSSSRHGRRTVLRHEECRASPSGAVAVADDHYQRAETGIDRGLSAEAGRYRLPRGTSRPIDDPNQRADRAFARA